MAEAGYCFQNAKIHIIYESNKFISTLPRYPAYGVIFFSFSPLRGKAL